jgi:hypothetical protein
VVEESEFAFIQAGRKSLRSLREGQASAPVSGAGLDHRRSGKRMKGVAVFVTLWVLFLGAVVGLVTWMRSGSPETTEDPGDSMLEQAENARFIEDAYHLCYETVMEFLHTSVVETRVQYVRDPLKTIRMMTRVVNRAPILGPDDKPRLEFFDRFETAEGPAMQSVWIMPEGERLEFVFAQDGKDSWKIDWPNLVRYSEEPWSLFVSGNGPDVGEFRLLARRRASSTGGQGDVSRLMLLEPRPWDPGQVGLSSPEVQVDPASEIGQQLKTAFAMREGGKGAFGARLEEKDPKGMIRVRVVLRRSKEKDEHGEWGFEIEKLIACHWLSFEESGFPTDEP